MKLINLTPHPVQIWKWDEDRAEDKCILSIPPEDSPARCDEKVSRATVINVDGVTVETHWVAYDEVYNLPHRQKGTLFVVSVLVAQARPDRRDLLFPYDMVRNENGRILGCRKLARVI